MHIPDGFLSAPVAIVFWVVSLMAVSYALKRVNRDLAERQVPMMGVLAACRFAAFFCEAAGLVATVCSLKTGPGPGPCPWRGLLCPGPASASAGVLPRPTEPASATLNNSPRSTRASSSGVAPRKVFPPDGAKVDLDGGAEPLRLKALGGQLPLMWFVNGAPVAEGDVAGR